LDKSLDEVIATRKTGRRTSNRGAKAALVGSPRPDRVPARVPGAQAVAVHQASDKIIVSNLPLDVNESQIRELFQTMIGPLREVTLTYDAAGRSKGIASVVFSRKGDGTKAYTQYHNRLIDGKRPMKIEIVLDPSKPAVLPSLVARVGTATTDSDGTQSVPYGGRGGRGRRGAPGRGRGGRRQGNDRPPKTVEDLDAEMEDYTGTAPAATAAS
ncbi:hypothetical protein K439DRAFT_1307329, partial [Ramaria rubella]